MLKKDAFGSEIKVGDLIAYPGRFSSSLWMTAAIVLEIEESGIRVIATEPDADKPPRKTRISVLSRVVPLDLKRIPSEVIAKLMAAI